LLEVLSNATIHFVLCFLSFTKVLSFSFYLFWFLSWGEKEKKRAQDLLSRIKVIPDQPSPRVSAVKESSKIKEQHKIIFGTGDQIKAITMYVWSVVK
jgi:hypothetical protein